jgi:hypothetical protein
LEQGHAQLVLFELFFISVGLVCRERFFVAALEARLLGGQLANKR